MASVISNQGLTSSFPGGSVTHLAPPGNPQPDPRAPLYQLPLGFLQSTANNYGSMAGGLGQLGSALGGMAGQHSGALAGLGNAMAQNYGAYGNTISGLGNAAANEAVGLYGAMSQAAQANQAGLGNMWTQAMAQLGGLGNTIAQSMGQGQAGYQSALAAMQGANQNAVSQYGQQQLGTIGQLGVGNAVSNMDFGFGGGGGGNAFQATGPAGEIASGSYGGDGGSGGAGGGGGADMSPYLDAAMGTGVLDRLAAADLSAQERLDNQQNLYRQDYGNLFGSGLAGLLTMGREGSGFMNAGMQDLYSNLSNNRTNFGQYLDAAGQGFRESSRDIRDTGQRMSDDYGSSLGALQGLAGQIGSGMDTANNTAMDFTKDLLKRFMPTAREQYEMNRDLANMRAADAQTSAMRSPYSPQVRMPQMSAAYQSALGMSPQRANALARDITYGRAGPRPLGPGQIAALNRYYRQG